MLSCTCKESEEAEGEELRDSLAVLLASEEREEEGREEEREEERERAGGDR
jgi:hypothetical protein